MNVASEVLSRLWVTLQLPSVLRDSYVLRTISWQLETVIEM